jgi:hypothetical protein
MKWRRNGTQTNSSASKNKIPAKATKAPMVATVSLMTMNNLNPVKTKLKANPLKGKLQESG